MRVACIFALAAVFVPLAAVGGTKAGTKGKRLDVRVTGYWRYGKGADRYTARGESKSGVRLRPGHCAVDPRLIPFGSVVDLPKLGLRLVAVDTGSAVRSRKASGGRLPVIDVFFERRQEALAFMDRHRNGLVTTAVVREGKL